MPERTNVVAGTKKVLCKMLFGVFEQPQYLVVFGLAVFLASCVSMKPQPLPVDHPASVTAPEGRSARPKYGLGSDADTQRTRQLLSQANQKIQKPAQPKPEMKEDKNNEPTPGMDMSGH
jgi:hypothetical protein